MSRQPLREGFTTSACAAAAAAAAVRALLSGQPVARVVIDLPARAGVLFTVHRCDVNEKQAMCSVIKDAGDDPDVTHGAEIQATVAWEGELLAGAPSNNAPAIALAGGPGVGVVTRPGLPVPVGEPAINPVPRRIITQAVRAALADAFHTAVQPLHEALRVTISVPGGEALAEKTLNPRLGILGGISILGTTGIVKPFSQPAYRASIFTELKAARANGLQQAVLTTGARSEDYAFQLLGPLAQASDLPPRMGYVQVGDHMGYALAQCQRLGYTQVVVSGMIGKLSKLAQGRMQTHVEEGRVDLDFLAELAAQLGAPDALIARVRAANTAHHAQTLLAKAGIAGLEQRIAERAAIACARVREGRLAVRVLLFSMSGALLAEARAEAGQENRDE